MGTRRQYLCGALFVLWCCGCQSTGSNTVAPSVRRDPVEASRLNQLGLQKLEAEEFDEAEKLLREAIAQDAFFGPAHSNLGICLLKLKRFYDAGWELRHAAKLMPQAQAPRVNLGLLYEMAGRYGAAEEQLRAALELDPENLEIIGQLARVQVRQEKDNPETIQLLERIAAEHTNETWRRWARMQQLKRTSPNFTGGV